MKISRIMAILVAFAMVACFATAASAQIEGAVVYLFDGNLTDSSSNGNDGDAVDLSGVAPATPVYSTNVPSITGGNYPGNRSLTLDQNTFINVAPDPSFSTQTGSFTFETWLNTSAPPNQSTIKTFVMKANLPIINPFPKWQMGLNQSQGLSLFAVVDDGPFTLSIVGTTQLNQNQWHHVAMVVDRPLNQVRLYVDGQLETLLGSGGPTFGDITGFGDLDAAGAGHTLTLGGTVQRRDPMPGFLDESRLSLRVLSDAEIAQSATMSLIPEPSTLSLLAIGGVALLMRRRRRA